MPEPALFGIFDPDQAEAKQKLRGTMPYFLSFIALGLISGSIGPAIPFISEALGVSTGDMSYFILTRSFGAIIAGYLFGRLYKKHRMNVVLAINLVIFSLLIVLLAIAPSFAFLLTVGFFIGLVHIGIDVGGNTSLIRIHDSDSPRFINALHACFGLGAFFSPLVVTRSVLWMGDYRWAFFLFAAILLITGGVFVFSPSPAVSDAETDRRAGSKKTDGLLLALIILMFVCYVGLEIGFTTWIFTYALDTGLGDTAFAGIINSLFWAVFTGGRFLAIPISRRIGPEGQITLNIVGLIVSFIALLVFRTSTAAFVIGVTCVGFFFASTYPGTMGYAQSRLNMTSREIGLIAIFASMSGMILPWITGQLFARQGPPWLIYSSLALTAALGIAFFFMVSYAGKRKGSQDGA